MKTTALFLTLPLLAASSMLFAQTTVSPNDLKLPSSSQNNPSAQSQTAGQLNHKSKKQAAPLKPFSRLALGGGVSLMGINMQAATNVNQHLNVRATGNYFNYTVDNISTNGFNVNGKVNFATGGVALDYYPFPSHGFRLSPGVLFYNQNQIGASGVGATGSSITLSGTKYYSETASPLTLNGKLGLNTRKQTATLTTGWGNMIPRKGGHWSFPFELGAAFTGVPTVDVALTGYACTNSSDAAIAGASCVNMATEKTAQANLTAQKNKWTSDLNPLQVYPIFSFGVTYSFPIR
ncbi:MAG: hypothetical protein P4K94_11845 [Terracidiphilus sp.]|nr:hypothetical protein [Terracidiphilus sp.]